MGEGLSDPSNSGGLMICMGAFVLVAPPAVVAYLFAISADALGYDYQIALPVWFAAQIFWAFAPAIGPEWVSGIMHPTAIGMSIGFGFFTVAFAVHGWYVAAVISGLGVLIFLGVAHATSKQVVESDDS